MTLIHHASKGNQSELQWGHAGPAVDDSVSPRRPPEPGWSFNGATAVPPWMTLIHHASKGNQSELQWGHGGPAVDDSVSPRRPPEPGWSFNGATAVPPWMTPAARRSG